MKIFLCVLLLASYSGETVKAEEGNNPEVKPESDISAGTKKVLRKIGRKSMDETCELTNTKEECAKQRLEHQKAARVDEADSERRRAMKEIRNKNQKKR